MIYFDLFCDGFCLPLFVSSFIFNEGRQKQSLYYNDLFCDGFCLPLIIN